MNPRPNRQGNQSRSKEKYQRQKPQEQKVSQKKNEEQVPRQQFQESSNQKEQTRINEKQQYQQQEFQLYQQRKFHEYQQQQQQQYQQEQIQQQRMNNNQFYNEQEYQQTNDFLSRQQQYQQNNPRVNLAEENQKFLSNNSFGKQKSYQNNNQGTPKSYQSMPNQLQNAQQGFQRFSNQNHSQKNDLQPFNNQGNNPKYDNLRPKSPKQPMNENFRSNNQNNPFPVKMQGIKRTKSFGDNNKQDKPIEPTNQVPNFSQQMIQIFSQEEDWQLWNDLKNTNILRSGWECSSCGQLNWWLRNSCKTCLDKLLRPFWRMRKLSPDKLQQFDYLFFIDYECNQSNIKDCYYEIIEFPIVVVDVKKKKITQIFRTFVKPTVMITKFITQLTTITDQDVAQAPNLKTTIQKVTEFLRVYTEVYSKPDRCAVVYDCINDADFLWNETTAKNIHLPEILTTYIDLKNAFPVIFSTPPRVPKSLADMQDILNQKFLGRQHRGIDDATNQAYVGIECLNRGYEFKKDMLVSINRQEASRTQSQQIDDQIDVIIFMEFDIQKSTMEIQEERNEVVKTDLNLNFQMKKDEENEDSFYDEDQDDYYYLRKLELRRNSNTKKNMGGKLKGRKNMPLNIDSIRSCSIAISKFDPKANQFYLLSNKVLTFKMFEEQSMNKSQKIFESNSHEQAPATQEQLKVFQSVGFQIESFFQVEFSSLKSKRAILMTSNKYHNLTTQLLLDSCFQIRDARILVLYLNYFTSFTEALYGMVRNSANSERFEEQFKSISQNMGGFSEKSAEQKIFLTIKVLNSLVKTTGKCILDRRNVKKVFEEQKKRN